MTQVIDRPLRRAISDTMSSHAAIPEVLMILRPNAAVIAGRSGDFSSKPLSHLRKIVVMRAPPAPIALIAPIGESVEESASDGRPSVPAPIAPIAPIHRRPRGNRANPEKLDEMAIELPSRRAGGNRANRRKPSPWPRLRPQVAFDRRRLRPRPAFAGEAEFHSFEQR